MTSYAAGDPAPRTPAGRPASGTGSERATAPPAVRPRRRVLPRALSGLTTRGRCLLAAGVAAAVCAVVLDERGLLRVAAFVVALPLLAAALAAASKVRIGARRTVTPERVPAGGDGDVCLDLWRTGRLPAGEILLEDRLPPPLGPRPRFVVERLPHHPVTLRYPIRPGMRGVHRIAALRATITDPFGLCEVERDLAAPSPVVVVPRVTPLRGRPGGAGTGGVDSGSNRHHAGQGDPDVMVRQYRTGDDMRKVHWRSTARRDEIMVRVEERPWRGGTTVLLDRRAAAHHGVGHPDGSLEWAVEFAASVCVHLSGSGSPVRLADERGDVLADLPDGAGPAGGGVVLDALAALQPAHERDLAVSSGPAHAQGHELIAVLGTVGGHGIAELTHTRPRGAPSLAVLVDTASWQQPGGGPTAAVTDTAALLRAAGWRVVVAGRRADVADIWAQLCRATATTPLQAGGSR
ncbi:Uncharacterized conserved protein, DUF58 family, contains vWF domain [Prauserella flava]|uniref:Uncharacterized protein (DUF58 family) n=1 Tax=Prauserella sediminis TaxID=577680 RepID=A0A839XPA0_9PSEU|nr:uncharacterized protein (DUF58 family) [Prauserella sediminis]MCR3718521.1 Uncharacterized conserved protein, DUF58 family, contains vWF domain [Prauserella flava]MCR3733091.1 Uncharacterized conserved protein, DUF58 family, contains vWF domain [Prauserella salsuginis]